MKFSVLKIAFFIPCFFASLAIGQKSEVMECPGRFGYGWNTETSGIYLPPQSRLGQFPLTVELWVKTGVKDQPHIFLSHGMQMSGDHWEIGSRRETGLLYCRFAAMLPAEIETDILIADGAWHYIAAIWDRDSIKLFVDNRVVVDHTVEPAKLPVHTAGLSLGTRTDERKLTQIFLDDIRISDRARDIVAAPELPLDRDESTLQLWNFEESREDYLARWTPGGETNQPNLPYPHQIAEYETKGESDWADGRWQETIKGPFVSHSFLIPNHQMGAKLTAVFLQDQTTVVFDTRACGFTAALKNSKMKVNPARFGLLAKPQLEGEVIWHVSPRKTWMKQTKSYEWIPFEVDEIDHQRLNLCGKEVLFQYRVAGVEIAEHAGKVTSENVFLRRWEVQPSSTSLYLTLAEGFKIDQAMLAEDNSRPAIVKIFGTKGAQSLTWSFLGDRADSTALMGRGEDVVLVIGPSESVRNIELVIVQEDKSNPRNPLEDSPLELALSDLPLLADLRKPGDRRWGEPLATEGVLASDDGRAPYLLDELTIPFDNPFKALFFISGFDFFPNGDAAVCTAHGDVWRVSGIAETLKNLRWQRYATGLYQPLGLKIWNGEVVVICRDQLIRLEDVNGNGEADIYHALNHDLHTLGGDHAYAMRLEQDQQGNLYFLKSSEGPPHGCSLIRWNRESNQLEVVATGFRHPYGLGIGPNDELTVADNEGNWVPSSKIDLIEQGGFYGYFEYSDKASEGTKPARPLCFIPKFLDNSSGGQVWVPNDQRWGNYHSGEMLHLSWGRCTLHAVLRQQVGNQWQAATVRFPDLVFRSGSGTAKFHPIDGQLYVVGLDGWQTGAVQDGCFSRVRFTGRVPTMPESFDVFPNGIRVRYSVDLDEKLNLDVSRFAIEQWNYRWSGTYGSFHYRPSQPEEIGHDRIEVSQISMLDKQTIFLHVAGLQPTDQIQLTANLATPDGRSQRHQIVGTINILPEPLKVAIDHPNETEETELFAMENLVAWCVVPFDAVKRGPRARAKMLAELGFKHLAYDWREEHVSTWEEEVIALREAGVNLTAFWAPVNTENPLDEGHWKQVLELIDRHQLKMQLWVMLNEGLIQSFDASKRVSVAAASLAPLARELNQRSCQLALYNHGGWSGCPENLVAIVENLRAQGLTNVGIAYNLHHAHDVLPEFSKHLQSMKSYLFCLNLNGMRTAGPKILPIGAGENDADLISQIRKSGYQGLIGILDHREELDSAQSLQENLRGLKRLCDENIAD